jgi:hypothetical protein
MERIGNGMRSLAALCAALALGLGTAATSARAEDAPAGASGLWEALVQGKPVLNVRGRIEIAEANGLARSESYTLRTRLGYGTKPLHGFRAFAEFENVATPSANSYFDGTRLPNTAGLTTIADPAGTEVNQGFLEFARADWLGLKLVGGRQRIVFDDSRFIGDVIWRQNQQTYDGAYAETSAGVQGLTARYGYIGNTNRIFGGGGNSAAAADFGGSSHVVNASYTRFAPLQLVGFAYLLDLTLPAAANPSVNSSKSFGARATGTLALGESWKLLYQGSYAYQSQYAGKAPAYAAHYALGDLGIAWSPAGTLGAGFELLGSDAGRQVFQTPLSTAHKFNGWADVFLDNGGPNGLRDFYGYLQPKLPWALALQLVYHRFWADQGGAVLGNEFDAQLTRSFGAHLHLLFKAAYFVAADGSPRPTTYRTDFDVVISF